MFTWHSLTFTWHSPDIHLRFTCHSPVIHLTIIWPVPDPYLTLISSLQFKKSCLMGGWWWWVDQAISDPSSGPSFDTDFDAWPWAWQQISQIRDDLNIRYSMVQIEALSTLVCQEGVPSQGGQQREEQRLVHHDQVEHYQGQFYKVSKGGHCSSPPSSRRIL